jgi:hypothetical protein
MLFARTSPIVSTTSTAPGSSRIAMYTRLPSRLAAMLFGWPLSGILVITRSVRASTTSSVEFASLLT